MICFFLYGQNVHLGQKCSVQNFWDSLSCLFIPYGPHDTSLWWKNWNFQIGMWRSSTSNLTTFKLRTFTTGSKFNECFKCLVVKFEFIEKFLFYDWFHTVWCALRAREHRQTCFFPSNLAYHHHTNYSYGMCNIIFSQWCVLLY